MMGAAALGVVAGCDDLEIAEESEEAGVAEAIGEAKQELLANYSNFSVNAGQMVPVPFSKVAGRRYTICINPSSGNANLYGHYAAFPTTNFYQFVSNNSGTVSSDNNKPVSDCIFSYAGSSGNYYLGVHGVQASVTNLWILETVQNDVPPNFYKALTWPVSGYTGLAEFNAKSYGDSYSHFGAPWGNHEAANRPFYTGPNTNDKNKIHAGVDIYVPAGTPVKAACDGTVRKIGSLGTDNNGIFWGYYSIEECTKNGTTISVGYLHLNNAGRPNETTPVIAGVTAMGTIYDLNVLGELDHLHLAICKGTYDQCAANGDQPQVGARSHTNFPGKMINPWISTNPDLWK